MTYIKLSLEPLANTVAEKDIALARPSTWLGLKYRDRRLIAHLELLGLTVRVVFSFSLGAGLCLCRSADDLVPAVIVRLDRHPSRASRFTLDVLARRDARCADEAIVRVGRDEDPRLIVIFVAFRLRVADAEIET